MAERFLNVVYEQSKTDINVTGMKRLSQVQKEIKFAYDAITVGYSKIELWVTMENVETEITAWTTLMALEPTYFAEGGTAVVIKLAEQGLIY